MKKVVTSNELREKMDEAISLLCDPVKTTLGPQGCNSIIDHSSFTPFITNDGVTIAQNITSNDETINTILELAKESAIKTDEQVGDGTTTTLVLLEHIYKNARTAIDQGINPIILKKELDSTLSQIICQIRLASRKPSKKELLNIATISGNSKEIGQNIFKAFQKVSTKNAIKLNETDNLTTTITYQKGYILDTLLASPYLLKNPLVLNNPPVLIFSTHVSTLTPYVDLLNEVIANKSALIIFASDFDEYLTNQIISINEQEDTQIILLKIPGFGQNKFAIQTDLAHLSNCTIVSDNRPFSTANIGHFPEISLNQNFTIITIPTNENINKYINTVRKELTQSENTLIKEQNAERLAMFTSGIIEINIGAPTKTECREKKMRYTDALCAINTASSGILPGSGIIFLKIAELLKPDTIANQIFIKALQAPTKQILLNAGLNPKDIINNLKKENYQKLYNLSTNQYEDIENTNVKDPTEVVINSLINATSLATMLITTANLIINETKPHIETNNFTEL